MFPRKMYQELAKEVQRERLVKQLQEQDTKGPQMKMDAMFPSKYISAADLQGKQAKVTIQKVTMEQLEEATEKPILYFKDRQKAMVLNRTNASTIAEAFGPDTDDWLGRDIVLGTAKVSFQGRLVDAVRVSIPEHERNRTVKGGDSDDLRF